MILALGDEGTRPDTEFPLDRSAHGLDLLLWTCSVSRSITIDSIASFGVDL